MNIPVNKRRSMGFFYPKNNCDWTNRSRSLCEETQSNSCVCVFRSARLLFNHREIKRLNSARVFSLVRTQLDEQRHLCAVFVWSFVCVRAGTCYIYWCLQLTHKNWVQLCGLDKHTLVLSPLKCYQIFKEMVKEGFYHRNDRNNF